MSEIGLRKCCIHIVCTIRIDGRKIISPPEVSNIYYSLTGEKHSISAISGRHYTVEHVNATGNCLQNICRSTNSHKVSWPIAWKNGFNNLNHFVHHLLRFANRKSTNSIAFAVKLRSTFGSFTPQLGINATLNDWKKGLRVTVSGVGAIKMFQASFKPLLSNIK